MLNKKKCYLLTCYSTQTNPNSENTSHLIAAPVVIVFYKKNNKFNKHSSAAKLAQIRFSVTCSICHSSVFYQLILLKWSLINRVNEIFQPVVCKVQDSSFFLCPATLLYNTAAYVHLMIYMLMQLATFKHNIFHSVTENEFYHVSSSKHIANISKFSSCLCCSWGGRFTLQKRKRFSS